MIIDTKCKKCRRAGEKLFLKGEKCFTPKCVFDKKPYAPGLQMSERKHRSMLTEYGRQLKEKQKVRNVYRLSERQFSKYIEDASSKRGVIPAEALYENLERRLDSVVFRLGLAASRSTCRQIVSHGHVTVNGKKLNVPSHKIRVGDVIGVRELSKAKTQFSEVTEKAKDASPAWITYDAKKLEGKIESLPKLSTGDMTFNLTSVIEFYSR